MKTTIDLPGSILDQAKALATAQGITLEQLLARTIEEKLGAGSITPVAGPPPWMEGFGALADLREENTRILRLIEEEFEQVELEDQQ